MTALNQQAWKAIHNHVYFTFKIRSLRPSRVVGAALVTESPGFSCEPPGQVAQGASSQIINDLAWESQCLGPCLTLSVCHFVHLLLIQLWVFVVCLALKTNGKLSDWRCLSKMSCKKKTHYNICSKLVSKAIHSSVKLAWCGLQFDFDSKVWSCRRINSSVFYCTLSEETFLTQWQQNRDSFTMQMVGYTHTH